MFEIVISKQVRKRLNLCDDNFVISFWEKAKIIANNPYNITSNIDITSLKGMPKGFYRLRMGGFRFLYEVRKNE